MKEARLPDYLPFVLILGTKKADVDHEEEYRFTVLPLHAVPPKGKKHQFCKGPRGAMRTHFIHAHFAENNPYPTLNAALADIPKARWWPESYTIQIEHFPDRCFPPDKPAMRRRKRRR